MKLIKPSFEIIPQLEGQVGMFKHIETCGRVAWKSEDRITEDSHVKFIEMLKGVNHGSVLEHGTVYLKYLWTGKVCETCNENIAHDKMSKYYNNKYSIVNRIGNELYITTNYRVLVDNNWLDDLYYACEPTEFHEKRITVRVICDRGVSHEYVRHRTFSFTQESTRYCNYSKDKYGSEIVFIQPCWISDEDTKIINSGIWETVPRDVAAYANCLQNSEHTYLYLTSEQLGWKAQEARSVLPNSLKTEMLVTAFISDWKHFFMLRTAKGAHPQAREIAIPLEQEFINLKTDLI